MKIEIIDQQKIKKINLRQLRIYLKQIFVLLNISSKKVSILLCDNVFIKKLNKKYFKKNLATDVIVFPLSDDFEPDYLGEVIASVEQAQVASKHFGNSWNEELVLYLVHGILHLIGYSDKTKIKQALMENKQKQILDKLGL